MMRTMLRMSMVGAFLLTGVVTSAWAFGPAGGSGIGMGSAGSRGVAMITGKVLCTNCSLDQMREAHPEMRQLYQLNHPKGQIVVHVHSVNGRDNWRAPQHDTLGLRSPAGIFQSLASMDNMMKEMEITSVLSKDGRNLDVYDVAVSG